MPKSKNGKNHKKKVAARNQRLRAKQNQFRRMQEEYINQMMEHQEIQRKAQVVQVVYKNRNELVTEVDGIWQLNEELIEQKEDGVLYWKDNQNPLIAGLDDWNNYDQYDVELFNRVLPVLQQQIKQQELAQQEASVEEVGLDFDIQEDPDFEVVEDTTDKSSNGE